MPLTPVQNELYASAFRAIVPEAVLVAAACGLFGLAVMIPRRVLAVGVAGLGVGGAALAAVAGPDAAAELAAVAARSDDPVAAVAPFIASAAADYVRWFAIVAAGIYILLSWPELRDDMACEYLACLLVLMAGTSLTARANDLVSLFLALEMVSIPTYVLLYLPARTRLGQEATAKYFLLSVLSSAVMLFGFSYLYGVTGSTNLGAVTATLSAAGDAAAHPLAVVGAVLAVAGLGFRVAAVPFHFYAPDVYQGGPTGVVAVLAVVPKVAGFAALMRVLGLVDPAAGHGPFGPDGPVPATVWVLAAVSMTFGNVMALLQTDLKRLFAYSGIAHTGYMLVGVWVAAAQPPGGSAAQSGADAVLLYLAAYGLMTAGAFAVVMYVGGAGRRMATVDDLEGLGDEDPFAGLMLAVFLLSLIGLPATFGFVGKLLLFTAAFELPADSRLAGPARWLVVIAAVNAAVAAAYYLRLLAAVARPPAAERTERSAVGDKPLLPLTAAVLCAVGTLVFGVYPRPLAQVTQAAAPAPTAQR